MSEASGPVTPLGVPPDAERVILFGGTFDPPHRAHVELPLAARSLIEATAGGASGGTWLVFVPAARSPHKQRGPEASDADRVAMLRLALAEASGPGAALAAIWTDEIDRAAWAHQRGGNGGPSYMVDTVRRAAQAAPEATLSLLIGADQAMSFHRWQDARRILALAEVFVLPRADVTNGAALSARLRAAGEWSEAELARWARAMLPTAALDVASTAVREWLREPARHRTELAAALGPAVLQYIEQQGLYDARV